MELSTTAHKKTKKEVERNNTIWIFFKEIKISFIFNEVDANSKLEKVDAKNQQSPGLHSTKFNQRMTEHSFWHFHSTDNRWRTTF